MIMNATHHHEEPKDGLERCVEMTQSTLMRNVTGRCRKKLSGDLTCEGLR